VFSPASLITRDLAAHRQIGYSPAPDGSTWNEVGSAAVPGQAATQDAGRFMTSHASGDPGL
jgi:hypothetical protein